jgi:RHS repeat-associated protein
MHEYIYTIDGAGNITAVSQGPPNSLPTTSYTYNAANEIATGNGHSYTSDADGNQTSNGNGLSTAYNPSQQTTSITEAGTTTPYAYFGTGQDQIATEGSNALHDDILGLASHQNGGSTAYFTRSIAGEQIDERTSSGTYNYLYDGNGSVVGLTNSQGQLVNQYSYDPYGNRTTTTATAPDYFGFQGGYLTPSGLYHFGARYYNPADERWTQEDPLANVGSLTQSDRYVFVGDDPVNLGDPNGRSIWGDIGSVVETGVDALSTVGYAGVNFLAAGACEEATDGLLSAACKIPFGTGVAVLGGGGYTTYREGISSYDLIRR